MYQRPEQEIIKNWKDGVDMPIVSICCTAYNQEDFIKEALEGFLIQETDFPFEILIHDDCSTDSTANIIRKYEKEYPNIIKSIYQKENQYSKGIKPDPTFNFPRAKGTYIARCEGDDYWTDPLKLQKQVYFLEKNTEYICCFHDSKIINKEGTVIGHSLLGSHTKDYNERELLSSNAFITTHSVMFRNVIEYPEKLQTLIPFGDMLLCHLMGFYGKAKYLSNIKKARYRKHPGGVWSSISNFQKFKKTLLSKNLIKEHLIDNSLSITDININIYIYIVQNLCTAIKHLDLSLYMNIIKFLNKKDYPLYHIFTFIFKSFICTLRSIIKKTFRYISNFILQYKRYSS